MKKSITLNVYFYFKSVASVYPFDANLHAKCEAHFLSVESKYTGCPVIFWPLCFCPIFVFPMKSVICPFNVLNIDQKVNDMENQK